MSAVRSAELHPTVRASVGRQFDGICDCWFSKDRSQVWMCEYHEGMQAGFDLLAMEQKKSVAAE